MERLNKIIKEKKIKISVGIILLYLFYQHNYPKLPKRIPPTPDGQLRRIFISGGAGGIGLETAIRFLTENWIVGVYDLPSAINNLHNTLQAHPHYKYFKHLIDNNLITGNIDVTDYQSCRDAIQHFSLTGKRLDALFNCAGILRWGPMINDTVQSQAQQISINCTGVLNLTYAALSLHQLQRDPKSDDKYKSVVVTMASESAVGGIVNCAVYSSTKCFVYSLTEALRSELAHLNVRVCDVSVSFVDTNMVRSQNKDNFGKLTRKSLEKIKPNEVSDTVWEAVNTAGYFKEHFYVRGCEWSFRLSWLLRTFAPSLRTRFLDNI